MRVVLIEDEVPALDHLETLLGRVAPDAKVVARLRTVRETRAWLLSGAGADVILADIELGDGLSLDAFAEAVPDVPIVFTTAFDHYLAPALVQNGIAYLLKPLREVDLAAALRKLRRLERHFLATLPAPPARVVGRRGVDWVSVPVAELAWINVRHGASWAVDRAGGELLLEQPLATLETTLDPARFYRVNRWYLVALDAIARVRSEGKGRLSLVLTPPAPGPVVVAQEGAAAFRAWFGLGG